MKEKNVLIVDDMPENITMLIELLKEDYFVQAATSGEKALALIKGGTAPDLILLDVVMPRMNGFEVLKKIKADPEINEIPVIFVTMKNEEVDEEMGLSIGAVDYLRKPYNPILVKQRVKSHLYLKHYKDLLEGIGEASKTDEELLEKFRMNFDAVEDGVVVTNSDSTVVWVNEAFTESTKYGLSELTGQNIRMLKSGLHNHEFYEELWLTIEDKGYWMGVIWNKSKDNTNFQKLLTIIKGDQSKAQYYIGIYRDLN